MKDFKNKAKKMNSDNKTVYVDLTDEKEDVLPVQMDITIQMHFRDMYQSFGKELTIEALNTYFSAQEKEQDNPYKIRYATEESDTNRQGYIDWIIQRFQKMDEEIDFKPSPKSIKTQNMADFWDDLLEQCRNQYEFNQGFANHYQDQFMKNFKRYEELLREESELNKQKRTIIRIFAQNVAEWAHLKFTRPTNEKRSQHMYVTTKNNQLRSILPNHFISRSIMRKLREQDSWCKNERMFEDEHHVGGGFCKDADFNF